MDVRLLRAALWRRRGTAALAILAVAIGVSVASALLHVSRDISHQLQHELRALGPNLLVLPESRPAPAVPGGAREDAAGGWVNVARARASLAGAGLPSEPELVVVAHGPEGPLQLIGADLEASRAMHPHWKIGTGPAATLMGSRLRARLGLGPTDTLRVEVAGRILALPAGATLDAGGPADDAWWVPLEAAQALADLPGLASLVQSRAEGPAGAADLLAARLEKESGNRVLVIRALSETESLLLERMRRLMTLVTAAALVAAGLCAFGTLTDLALARRREIALMKALGAGERDIVRALTAEAAVIGLLGGLLGFAIGLVFALLIGRQVFNASIAMRWDVVPVVLALALGVAGLASFGPIRLALNTDPATVLKGD